MPTRIGRSSHTYLGGHYTYTWAVITLIPGRSLHSYLGSHYTYTWAVITLIPGQSLHLYPGGHYTHHILGQSFHTYTWAVIFLRLSLRDCIRLGGRSRSCWARSLILRLAADAAAPASDGMLSPPGVGLPPCGVVGMLPPPGTGLLPRGVVGSEITKVPST